MTSTHVGIGPANYAGQADAWARAVNRLRPGLASSFTVQRVRQGYNFSTSHTVPSWSYYCPVGALRRFRRRLAEASHLLLDGFRPVAYGYRVPSAFERQARRLAKHYQLGLIAHGTDIRDPQSHLERNEFSYFAEGDEAWRRMRTEVAKRNRAVAERLGQPVFVSTPDMLFDLPEATWLPVTVDVAAWACDEPVLEREKPRVLFAPSQRTPPIKGTRYVDPVLRELDAHGVIEYVPIQGVPHAQMPALVKSADVVVDQLLFGSYGVAAVEAMAAGKIVIGNIDSIVGLGIEVPQIVRATPHDFRDVIVGLRERREEMRRLAQRNVEFVRTWHNGQEAAQRIIEFVEKTS